MARPAHTDSAVTRRRILDAASTLFAQHGPGLTSMRDIAARSKVTVGTIHFHFGDKDRLWDACVDSMYAELGELQAALEPEFRKKFDLDSTVAVIYRFAVEHQLAIRLVLRNVLETGDIGEKNREQSLRPFLDNITVVLESLTGRKAETLRFPVQSLIFLIGRYAIASKIDLAAAHGAGTGDPHRAVEKHLAEVARQLLT